jgi:predicted transposase YdaD
MVLTTTAESQASADARYLLARVQQEVTEPTVSQAIIEMITTIMVYKFTQLSRREIEQMMGLRLEDTRVYREAKEEGRQEGLQEGLQEGRQEGLQEGQRSEALSLVLRLLPRRCGVLSESVKERIASLPLPTLEALSEALLDFTSLADLETWFAADR